MGVEDRRVPLPEHQHFSHSLISSFLLPSFLPAYSSCSCPLPYYPYSLVPPTITARPLPPRLAFRLQRQLRPAPHGRPVTTTRLEQLFSSRPFIGLSTFRPISSSSTAHPRVYRTDRDIRIDIQTRLLYWSTALLPSMFSCPSFFAAPPFDASLPES